MKSRFRIVAIAIAFLAPSFVLAQAPAGSTGQCKDGTYTSASSKRGACRGHQGVANWFAESTAAPAPSKAKATPVPAAAPAAAPAPAAAGKQPSGATGQCKDGTFTMASSKKGACRGHLGVAAWYAESTPAAKAPTPAPAPAAAASAPAPATTPQRAPVSSPAPSVAPAASKAVQTPVAGGGPGLVWLNTSTNVYHCAGTRYYGTTKAGKYMTEAEAKAAGGRPDHNKPCTQ